MIIRLWPEDTIKARFALTTLLAVVVTVALSTLVIELGGAWARPPIERFGVLGQVRDIVRMIDAAPASARGSLGRAVTNPQFRVEWYPATSPTAAALDALSTGSGTSAQGFKPGRQPHPLIQRSSQRAEFWPFEGGDPPSEAIYFRADDLISGAASLHLHAARPDSYLLAVKPRSGGWIVFTTSFRFWGIGIGARIGIGLALLLLSISVVSCVATNHLVRPITQFTKALQRFGADPRVEPIPETGPRELRASVRAFNAMQAQIQTFVNDRTVMLAAISHDLRTPLTKMRLRGELIEDGEQRARLFRDVDDMQAMIESALAFFRDDVQSEESTSFDFPEMLRTIIDDYSDQGFEIAYEGPDHMTFRGRPFALKRAFTNLIENAVKYGRDPQLGLSPAAREITVAVSDRGPGIPQDDMERVFTPFYRVERSRNRATGGAGLGLTSARNVIHAHGGDIRLHGRPGGGLVAEVVLPISP